MASQCCYVTRKPCGDWPHFIAQICWTRKVNAVLQSDKGIEQIYGDAPYYQIFWWHKITFWYSWFYSSKSCIKWTYGQYSVGLAELRPTRLRARFILRHGKFYASLLPNAKSAVRNWGRFWMVQKAAQMPQGTKSKYWIFPSRSWPIPFVEQPWDNQSFNKILLDPPRSGVAFRVKCLCASWKQENFICVL